MGGAEAWSSVEPTDMDEYLRARDLMVRRALQQPGAPPVVGLVELEDPKRVVAAVVRFVGGHAQRFKTAFEWYPYVTTWAIATVVRQSYRAEANYAVYKPIADWFAIALPQNGPGQKALRKGFGVLCRRIGVTTAKYGRQVDVYLAQAGVPEGMLSHLAAAFLRQERHFGPAPTDDTEALNHWEKDSLHLLPPGVVTPRRALELDETGWHAGLFARLREASGGDGSWFEEKFREEIEAQERVVSVGGGVAPIARPRLTWLDGSPGLSVPRLEGRMKLRLDEANRLLRLRGGEAWRLPEPWPRELRWEAGSHTGTIEFLPDPSALASFDRRPSGRFLGESLPDGRTKALDGVDIVVLSRGLFSVGGEPCEARADTHIAAVTLSAQPVRIETLRGDLFLKSRPKRRITAHGGTVATGPQGTLHGPGTEFRIETGQAVSETRTLRIHAADNHGALILSFDTDGVESVHIEEVLRAVEVNAAGPLSDPCRLRLDLGETGEATSTGRSAVLASFWIWPRLASSGGFVLDAPEPPTNLALDSCRHITRTRSGQVCLDSQGGYDNARLAFRIDGADIGFDVPFPGETCVRVRANGHRQFLPRGAQVILDEDDRFDIFTVRCPDRGADFLVRGRRESKPFRSGRPRHVSGVDLLQPAGDDRVVLFGSNGVQFELFRIVEPRTPKLFEVRHVDQIIRLTLGMSDPLEAVRLLVEDEWGERTTVEAALGAAPAAGALRLALVPDAATPDGDGTVLTIDPSHLPEVLHLARILVQGSGRDGWTQLGNPRGDVFVLAFEGGDARAGDRPTDNDGLDQRFRTLSGWLAQCFAPESWVQVRDPLRERWRTVGEHLYETGTGRRAVLAATGIGPPEEAAASWVPIAHPLSFLPEMYGAPANDFAACASAEDPGSAALMIVSDVETANLRDSGLLDHAALLGFANVHEAQTTGTPLREFDPTRFLENLAHPHIDADPSAGWFWRGRPFLGPAHWRAAYIRFAERCDAAEVFTEDDADMQRQNGLRQIHLLRMMSACDRLSDWRPPVPKRDIADQEPTVPDRLASATLCAFTRAARAGRAAEWADALAKNLNCSRTDVLTDAAFLLRLAPELFAFYMGMWQLTDR